MKTDNSQSQNNLYLEQFPSFYIFSINQLKIKLIIYDLDEDIQNLKRENLESKFQQQQSSLKKQQRPKESRQQYSFQVGQVTYEHFCKLNSQSTNYAELTMDYEQTVFRGKPLYKKFVRIIKGYLRIKLNIRTKRKYKIERNRRNGVEYVITMYLISEKNMNQDSFENSCQRNLLF
ncbi:hypothetical protein TTHERM_00633260 (macronuclear) [Tetrahymena thermophila SB210]|uniref:Uncharacterized protein n=1 Tax=Tetrahymena thermophila (strain SB210) TaxID=312017 RepID=Q22X27_TETTS|nr:hypothetical protein TTHERM_00633260 [Tetrahymena thermophila SB210]EAR89819.1 hypothetical protein TTHERM_00633260 [Tetrahymena thermophila SB210]|eukprot:XP_001010064.1 hypothetical protein TTHERM_00633260 [Tetrahymena thermophila SB210]